MPLNKVVVATVVLWLLQDHGVFSGVNIHIGNSTDEISHVSSRRHTKGASRSDPPAATAQGSPYGTAPGRKQARSPAHRATRTDILNYPQPMIIPHHA